MCKIIILQSGYTLPFEMLQTATFNNPHGYGLVLKDKGNKKLQIIRKCDPGKENDPKEIHDLLKNNEDVERILHLRWRTEGPINMENTHPFDTYHSGDRTVVFMHNGTLHDYKPNTHVTWVNGVRTEHVTGDENVSDSKRFNDIFLSPLLVATKGNIADPIISQVITKFWGLNSINRGILIASDQDHLIINEKSWEKIKDADGKEFLASNNTYFKDITRGPEFERRKKAAEEKAAQRRQESPSLFQGHNSQGGKWPVTPLRDVDLKRHGDMSKEIGKLLNNIDVWTTGGLAQLENLTAIEVDTLVKQFPDDASSLLIHLTSEFAGLYKKHTRASEYLSSIQGGKKAAA